MRVARALHHTASSMSSIYRIVFTGMMLVELVRYGLRRKRANEAIFAERGTRGGNRYGAAPGDRKGG